MNFKILTLIIMAVVLLYQLLKLVLSIRSFSNPIPECVKDVYDEETFAGWRKYSAEKARLGIVSTVTYCLITALLIVLDAFSWFAGLFKGVYLQYFAVTLLSVISSQIPGTVFAYIDDMVIEQKYGFNRSTRKTFIADRIKEFLIELLISAALTALLASLHRRLGDGMLVLFGAALFVITLAITLLFPFLSKVFNKFTPLEDGELKEKLTSMLTSHGYTVRAIQVMDASKRSSKSNAYFTGLGKTKTIVLYDTLLTSSTPDEICAVFAHEMGHGLHHDTLKMQLLNIVNIACLAVCAFAAVKFPEVYKDFGFDKVNYGFALILIGETLMSVVSPLIGMITNFTSRRAEYRADAQAVKEGFGDALVGALKTLARANFSHLSPSRVLVALEYSHPPLAERIRAIEALKAEKTE